MRTRLRPGVELQDSYRLSHTIVKEWRAKKTRMVMNPMEIREMETRGESTENVPCQSHKLKGGNTV